MEIHSLKKKNPRNMFLLFLSYERKAQEITLNSKIFLLTTHNPLIVFQVTQ